MNNKPPPRAHEVTLVLSRLDAHHIAVSLERGSGSPGWDIHSRQIAKIIREALTRAREAA